jgi:hypothetical protein
VRAQAGIAAAARKSPIYLSLPEVVERYAGIWSRWTIYEHVRAGLLPHLKLPGRRELLFPLRDLERYEAGECELETVKLPRGGRSCRPRTR